MAQASLVLRPHMVPISKKSPESDIGDCLCVCLFCLFRPHLGPFAHVLSERLTASSGLSCPVCSCPAWCPLRTPWLWHVFALTLCSLQPHLELETYLRVVWHISWFDSSGFSGIAQPKPGVASQPCSCYFLFKMNALCSLDNAYSSFKIQFWFYPLSQGWLWPLL